MTDKTPSAAPADGLPPLPELSYLGDDVSYGYDANDMHDYARDALAAATPAPAPDREAIARAICLACEENPDHRGDARGNDWRWQDYLGAADAAIAAGAAPAPARDHVAELAAAAQAVIDRWDSPTWEWARQGPTADLMAELRRALARQAPVAGERNVSALAQRVIVAAQEAMDNSHALDDLDAATCTAPHPDAHLAATTGEPVAIDGPAFDAAVAARCGVHAASSRTLALIRSAARSGADDALLGRACRQALAAAGGTAPQQCPECIEQARLLGMGAEREAALQAQVEQLTRVGGTAPEMADVPRRREEPAAGLHDAIMNLRADGATLDWANTREAYLYGHRDARHAAAELAAAVESECSGMNGCERGRGVRAGPGAGDAALPAHRQRGGPAVPCR